MDTSAAELELGECETSFCMTGIGSEFFSSHFSDERKVEMEERVAVGKSIRSLIESSESVVVGNDIQTMHT